MSTYLSSKAISANVGEIFKLPEFACRKAFTDDHHIFFLQSTKKSKFGKITKEIL